MTALSTMPAPCLVHVAVNIGHAHPPVSVTGWQVSPELAVTPALRRRYDTDDPAGVVGFSGLWTVTHLPTGRKVPAGRGIGVTEACLSHAVAFARRLAATGIDWSADRMALAADPAVRHACRTVGADFADCAQPVDCTDRDDGDDDYAY